MKGIWLAVFIFYYIMMMIPFFDHVLPYWSTGPCPRRRRA